MTSTIREFEAWPEHDAIKDGRYTFTWRGKVSIDLTWVSGAYIGIAGEGSTAVVLAGSDRSQAITINCAYPDFMKMWMEARA